MERPLSGEELRIFEICRQIELVNAEIYLYFVEIFSDIPWCAELWGKTAREEQNHAAQFELAMKMKRGVIESVVIDKETAANALKVTESILAEVKGQHLSLEDALRASIKLEIHLAEFHMDCITIFKEESFAKMFKAMMAADEYHLKALQNAYKDYQKGLK
jgi:rubrerythrin